MMTSNIGMRNIATRSNSLLGGLRRYSNTEHKVNDNYQTPVKAKEDEPVYIVTLGTSEKIRDPMNELRRKYFPAERLHVDAHLTFFHALPESKLEKRVIPKLKQMASLTETFYLATGKVRRLSQGIAIDIRGGQREAADLRHKLKKSWIRDGWLSRQDKANSVIHYTVMNKVGDQDKIDLAIQEIEQDFPGAKGFANGLVLWRYANPGWEFVQKFPFVPLKSVKQKETSGNSSSTKRKETDQRYSSKRVKLSGTASEE